MVEFVERGGRDKHPLRKPAVKPAVIQATCPACGHSFQTPQSPADSEVACPQCAKPVPVPGSGEAPPPSIKPASVKAQKGKMPRPIAPRTQRKDAAAARRQQETPDAPEGPEVPGEAAPPLDGAAPVPDHQPRIEKPSTKKSDLKTKPKCPECGASMDKDAVICVYCGYDQRGEAPVTRPTMVMAKTKGFPLVPALVALILLSGAIFYAFVMRKDSGPTPATPEDSPETMDSNTPAADTETNLISVLAAEADAASRPVAPVPAPEPEPAVEAPPPAPAPVATAPTGEPDLRQQITARLDSGQPLVHPNDQVLLTTRDGASFRGKIIEINESGVRLYYQGSESEIPLGVLSQESRAQVDPVYREQLIDSLVRRYRDQPPAAR